MKWVVCGGLALVLVSGFVTGDLIQDTTGLHWQWDGGIEGVEGDAGDDCAHAGPALTVGTTAEGLLVPVDDEADFYLLPIPATAVNVTVNVSALGQRFEVGLDVFTPQCAIDLRAIADGSIPPGHEPNNRGRGHTMCRGDGHLECTVRDVQAGDGWVSFVPVQQLTFVVEVTLILPEVPVPSAPGPEPDTCHSFCMALIDGLVGYHVVPGAPQ
jgi:hypothetical protein